MRRRVIRMRLMDIIGDEEEREKQKLEKLERKKRILQTKVKKQEVQKEIDELEAKLQ